MVKVFQLNEQKINRAELDAFLTGSRNNWRQYLVKGYPYWYPTHPGNDPEFIGDTNNWAIWIIRNRDSEIVDQVNYEVVENSLTGSMADDVDWIDAACPFYGWVKGVAFRLYDSNNRPTKAAMLVFQIQSFLNDCYPILDEDETMSREFQAKQESIAEFIKQYELDDSEEIVYNLAENVDTDGHGSISWFSLKDKCIEEGLINEDYEDDIPDSIITLEGGTVYLKEDGSYQ